jgi:hypothetical protein
MHTVRYADPARAADGAAAYAAVANVTMLLPPLAQLLVCATLQTCASRCAHRQTCTSSDMQILHSLLVLVLLLLLLLSGSPESDIATAFDDCRYDSVYFLITISCSDIVYVMALIADLCGLRQVHLHAAQLSWTPCPGTAEVNQRAALATMEPRSLQNVR